MKKKTLSKYDFNVTIKQKSKRSNLQGSDCKTDGHPNACAGGGECKCNCKCN